MTTLVFTPVLGGHYLEYLHHIYMGAIERPDDRFVMAVPAKEWEQMKSKRPWPEAANVEWLMLDDAECKRAYSGGQLSQCRKVSCMVRRAALECGADRILLISLATVIPLLPLMLPARIKLSGIIYKIYLRGAHGRVRRMFEWVRYTVMACSRSMGRVFILNDPRSAAELNRRYHTDRFTPLPDPVPDVNPSALSDLRAELGIPAADKIYLHFGAMGPRKGTLEILRAIELMTAKETSGRSFIFAGRVNDQIKHEFYDLVHSAKAREVKILVRDEFVDYAYLNDLCHTCDCILIPYMATDLSSGALGYAAVHGKPVIGPSTGLIGDLIRDNHLGIVLPKVDIKELKQAILSPLPTSEAKVYATANSVANFIHTLLQ